jgi:hypothetical protein
MRLLVAACTLALGFAFDLAPEVPAQSRARWMGERASRASYQFSHHSTSGFTQRLSSGRTVRNRHLLGRDGTASRRPRAVRTTSRTYYPGGDSRTDYSYGPPRAYGHYGAQGFSYSASYPGTGYGYRYGSSPSYGYSGGYGSIGQIPYGYGAQGYGGYGVSVRHGYNCSCCQR